MKKLLRQSEIAERYRKVLGWLIGKYGDFDDSDFTESPVFQRFPKRFSIQYNADERNIDKYPIFCAKILKILTE